MEETSGTPTMRSNGKTTQSAWLVFWLAGWPAGLLGGWLAGLLTAWQSGLIEIYRKHSKQTNEKGWPESVGHRSRNESDLASLVIMNMIWQTVS